MFEPYHRIADGDPPDVVKPADEPLPWNTMTTIREPASSRPDGQQVDSVIAIAMAIGVMTLDHW
jgi:hypothetical protein